MLLLLLLFSVWLRRGTRMVGLPPFRLFRPFSFSLLLLLLLPVPTCIHLVCAGVFFRLDYSGEFFAASQERSIKSSAFKQKGTNRVDTYSAGSTCACNAAATSASSCPPFSASAAPAKSPPTGADLLNFESTKVEEAPSTSSRRSQTTDGSL